MISVQLFCFKGGFVCAVSLYQTDLGLGYFVWLFVVVVFGGETQELLDFCDDLFV